MWNYYLGLGSNLSPHTNVVEMLKALMDLSDEVIISRVIQTQPAGFPSEKIFLNLAARIQSELEPEALKQRFNQIEIDLGRDRTDPNRKLKDRVADIDILFYTRPEVTQVEARELPPEPYLRAPVVELLDHLEVQHLVISPEMPEGVELELDGKKIGKTPGSLLKLAAAA
jgi:2-amino-4-hydroxy-6-hydroxymethyldihydropteridine diphosphokinase